MDSWVDRALWAYRSNNNNNNNNPSRERAGCEASLELFQIQKGASKNFTQGMSYRRLPLIFLKFDR